MLPTGAAHPNAMRSTGSAPGLPTAPASSLHAPLLDGERSRAGSVPGFKHPRLSQGPPRLHPPISPLGPTVPQHFAAAAPQAAPGPPTTPLRSSCTPSSPHTCLRSPPTTPLSPLGTSPRHPLPGPAASRHSGGYARGKPRWEDLPLSETLRFFGAFVAMGMWPAEYAQQQLTGLCVCVAWVVNAHKRVDVWSWVCGFVGLCVLCLGFGCTRM